MTTLFTPERGDFAVRHGTKRWPLPHRWESVTWKKNLIRRYKDGCLCSGLQGYWSTKYLLVVHLFLSSVEKSSLLYWLISLLSRLIFMQKTALFLLLYVSHNKVLASFTWNFSNSWSFHPHLQSANPSEIHPPSIVVLTIHSHHVPCGPSRLVLSVAITHIRCHRNQFPALLSSFKGRS